MKASETDRGIVDGLSGLFVGQLDDAERESFDRCVSDKYAYWKYEGTAGFMGLAKVGIEGR